jgi:hypothetical protein
MKLYGADRGGERKKRLKIVREGGEKDRKRKRRRERERERGLNNLVTGQRPGFVPNP